MFWSKSRTATTRAAVEVLQTPKLDAKSNQVMLASGFLSSLLLAVMAVRIMMTVTDDDDDDDDDGGGSGGTRRGR